MTAQTKNIWANILIPIISNTQISAERQRTLERDISESDEFSFDQASNLLALVDTRELNVISTFDVINDIILPIKKCETRMLIACFLCLRGFISIEELCHIVRGIPEINNELDSAFREVLLLENHTFTDGFSESIDEPRVYNLIRSMVDKMVQELTNCSGLRTCE